MNNGDAKRDNRDSETDEKAFNETLKRMLKTPPKPHDKPNAPEEAESPPAARPSKD